MVTLLLDVTRLEVVLSGTERVLARRTESLKIAREQITKVQLTDDGWPWLRGVPSPGTAVRGVIAMGTWAAAGTTDFVIVRRHRPGVVIDLSEDAEFQRVVLTTRHGVALVQALHLDAPDGPDEVTEIGAGTAD
ncbi:hypothetical protein N3K63_05225 [Microbacterium sp. W1N]|uniref:hypothetical protein n=1 Tax=Microbacterium festucae TaxID=2977531 RepID=UPI0021C248D0|nr:hypothetical protein [Microbacterium festucae]MCT9819686.1 hypothetical protein [Microbacterium festucae]